MAEKKQCIKWILSEIPRLKEQGIVPEDSALLLEEHFRSRLEALPSPQKIFSLVLGIIGIIMAAAGVILFLNYNWDMFSKTARITLAAFPLFVGAVISYFTIISGRGQLWREVSAVLTSAGAGTLIAVLSQIYHTGGELYEFMFLLLLLSLPLVYIFNSVGLASIYLFLSFFVTGWNITPWWNPFILLLLLPWLIFHIREKSPWKVWCRYLLLAAGISLFCGGASSAAFRYYALLPGIILCSIFLVGGIDLFKANGSFVKNPWLIPAFAVQCVLLAIGSSTEDLFRIFSSQRSVAALWTFGTVCSFLALIFIFQFCRRRITLERSLSLLLILLTLLPLAGAADIMRIIFNIYLGLVGIVFLRSGIKQSSLLFFNGGAIMLCTLTCCRFFDSGIGVLYRSAGLVVLGIGFMLGNWLFVKFSREVKK